MPCSRLPAADVAALTCATALIVVLPLSHVTALRSFALFGLLLWLLTRLPVLWPSRPPLLAAFGVWLAAGLLSLTTASDAKEAWQELRGDVLYSWLVFLAFWLLARTHAILPVLRRALLAVLLLASCAAIAGHLLTGRWPSEFPSPIGEYATFVVTALPLMLTVFLPPPQGGGRWERGLALAALIAVLIGLTLAASRWTWLVLAASGGLWLLLQPVSPSRRMRSLAIAGALLALALGMAHLASQQRATHLTHLHGREAIYALAIEQIAARPLTGHGFGRENNREAYKEAFPGAGIRHAHNLVLSYGEQMGLGGLLALLLLFGGLANQFLRLYRQKATRALASSGLTLLCAVMLKNMTDMFFTGSLLLLFMAGCGLLLGSGHRLTAADGH